MGQVFLLCMHNLQKNNKNTKKLEHLLLMGTNGLISSFKKVTKFLIKISQFEFLVMAEKKLFIYQLFLSLNISDFSLFFK